MWLGLGVGGWQNRIPTGVGGVLCVVGGEKIGIGKPAGRRITVLFVFGDAIWGGGEGMGKARGGEGDCLDSSVAGVRGGGQAWRWQTIEIDDKENREGR